MRAAALGGIERSAPTPPAPACLSRPSFRLLSASPGGGSKAGNGKSRPPHPQTGRTPAISRTPRNPSPLTAMMSTPASSSSSSSSSLPLRLCALFASASLFPLLPLLFIPSANAFSFNIDNTPQQCQNLSISITGSGGVPPYRALVLPFGFSPLPNAVEVRKILDQPFSGDATQVSFQLPYPALSQFVVVVRVPSRELYLLITLRLTLTFPHPSHFVFHQ